MSAHSFASVALTVYEIHSTDHPLDWNSCAVDHSFKL